MEMLFDRSNAVVVLKNGDIGIGTNAPKVPLNFASTLGDKIHCGEILPPDMALVYNPACCRFIQICPHQIAFGYGSSASCTENMRIKGNGNVGIGTNSPTQKLHIVGNICYIGSSAACSDIRYKTSIVPLSDYSRLTPVLVVAIKEQHSRWRKCRLRLR